MKFLEYINYQNDLLLMRYLMLLFFYYLYQFLEFLLLMHGERSGHPAPRRTSHRRPVATGPRGSSPGKPLLGHAGDPDR